MRRIFLPIILMFVVVASANTQKTAEPNVDPKLWNEILKADADQSSSDRATLDRTLGDDLFWINSRGKFSNKMEVVNETSGSSTEKIPNKHDDIQMHVYGDVVVVSGRSTYMSQDKDGNAIPGAVNRYISVWVKRAGQWTLVAHQATRVPEK